MANIDITPAGNDLFRVEITDGGGTSTHQVSIPDGYPHQLGVGDVSHQDLVFASIRFLLERESKEQIMSEFALPVIARYFPDYENEIADRVGRLGGGSGQPPPDGDPRRRDAVGSPPEASGDQSLEQAADIDDADQGPEALH